jgi:hypothetical protein
MTCKNKMEELLIPINRNVNANKNAEIMKLYICKKIKIIIT